MVLYHDPIAHLSSPPRTGWISLCWLFTQHPLGLLLASWISISGSWYLCPSKDQYSDVDRSCRLFHATSLHWPSPTPLFIFNDTQSHFGLSSFLWLLHSVVSLNKFHFFWLYIRAFVSAFPSLSFWTQHTFSISALWYTDDESLQEPDSRFPLLWTSLTYSME